jgi:hypothetical protein
MSTITQMHTSSKLFCSEQNIVWLVPSLLHELLLLSPSSNYPLLNGYHNLCAVNYTSTHVFAPK